MKIKLIKTVSFFCVLSLILNSCKKKDDVAASSPSSNPTPTAPTGDYGNLQSGYTVFDYGNGVLVNDSNVIINFYSGPSSNIVPPSIYAGTVAVNNYTLNLKNTLNFYVDTTHLINIQQLNWTATGSGTVAAFTYSYMPVYPKYSGVITVLDTCVKSTGFNISLSGIVNANAGVTIDVYQGSTKVSKKLNTSSGIVNFSASDLSSLTVNTPLTISLMFANLSHVNIGSVNYGITTTYQYIKFSNLK